MIRIAWLVPFFPLLGAALAACGPKRLRAVAHQPVIAGIALAFLVSLLLLPAAGADQTVVVMRWLSADNLEVPVEFRVDGLTTMMLSMVTFVSALVTVFAAGYMAGDPGYARFFALIGLFVFSMTGLVLSNNYLLTYVFWEGVGVCSYLLIGFWHTRPSAAAAAVKAFMVNRLGDVGFAIAIFWMWASVPNHDLSYTNVLSESTLASIPHATIVGIALLLFWGATAKSAQIPLYVWLPDAMEGPTPVSALIHAATMVTAGVYLIARSMPLLALAPGVGQLVAITGCATALLAAAIAVTQNDLKRVLAYSTVSQLGYMFMALGSGVGNVAQLAVVAAMFHLFTHAFFKALLFLAAGSVMHAMGDVIDMRRFGGLRDRLPHTYRTFAVGVLALAAIFPLSGFFSKDEILLALRSAAHPGGFVYIVIYVVALVTAFLTAFYTGRAFFLTFWGPEKLPSPSDPEAPPAPIVQLDAAGHGDGHAHGEETAAGGHDHGHEIGHESPPIMIYPLYALAGCTVLIGVVCLLAWPFAGATEWFGAHLHKTLGFESLGHAEHGFDWVTALIGLAAGLGGLGLAYVMYGTIVPAGTVVVNLDTQEERRLTVPERSALPARLAAQFRPLYEASLHKFRVDEAYDWLIVKPVRAASAVCGYLDDHLVDPLVIGVAKLPALLGRDLMARYQNGMLQFYAGVSALCLALLVVIFLFL